MDEIGPFFWERSNLVNAKKYKRRVASLPPASCGTIGLTDQVRWATREVGPGYWTQIVWPARMWFGLAMPLAEAKALADVPY